MTVKGCSKTIFTSRDYHNKESCESFSVPSSLLQKRTYRLFFLLMLLHILTSMNVIIVKNTNCISKLRRTVIKNPFTIGISVRVKFSA